MKTLLHIVLGAVFVLSGLFFSVPQAQAAYGDVSYYAGSIYGGDGGSRLNAYFDFPEGIAGDSSGNFYIADTYNNVIRKIASNGIVSTLAGTGGYGSADGAVDSAKFALPKGVAWGSDGSVYVADSANGKIRKINNGTVSTLVSGLSDPHGVTPYGATLYFSDSGNNAIKKVSTSGGTVTTLTTGVSDPRHMAISSNGTTLYVADNGHHRVVAVDTSSGAVSVIAGSGTSGYQEGIGTAAQFENVWGVALDGNYLYVVDHDNWTVDRVRKINLSTNQTSLVYQDTRQNELIYPSGLVVYGGYVYVINAGLGTVHKFNSSNGSDNSLYAGADRFGNKNGSRADALFGRPYDLTMTRDGEYLYVADNNKIRKINISTGMVSQVIGSSVDNYRGEGTDEDALPVRFSTIQSIAVNSAGTRLYVVDRWNNRIRGVNLQADPVKSFLVSGAGLINTRGADNNGYQEGIRCAETVQTTGVAGCSYFRAPAGLAIDPTDTYLYVSDTGNNRIRKVRISDGRTWLVAGSGSAGFQDGSGAAAKFNRPWGVTLDPSGSNLYVADSNNHAIRKIDLSTNAVTTVVGNGTAGYLEAIGTKARLSYPEYVKMDGEGNLYFSESGSQRVRLVEIASGLTKLVAGSGVRGYKNGSKTIAQFDNPKGLAVGSNVLYVADNYNDVIRRITVTGTAPYSEPAPVVSSVSPELVNPAWDKGEGLLVKVEGANFTYGIITYLGNFAAVKTYVQTSTSLAVELPLSQMSPGWYDITVIKPDGQMITLEHALGITDGSGNIPDIYYEYSGKTAETTAGSATGTALSRGSSFFSYDQSLRGGYYVSAGNVMGTSESEIITGTGVGMGPQVRVFDSSGVLKSQFFAFDSNLRNGVTVTACDVNGDGYDEIVTAQGRGGWPIVKIFDGRGKVINDGFPVLDGRFTGGVNLSCGDTDGDGISEIVVAAMRGGGPHVLVYNVDGKILTNFMAYDPHFRGGINISTLDMDGDGRDEIVTGPQYGAPHVQIFQIRPNELKRLSPGFYAFDSGYRGGVSVVGVDTDGDGTKELLVGVGDDALSLVKVYNIREELSKRFYTYASSFVGGLRLGGGDVDGDGADELLVMPRGGGGPNVRVINVDEV